MCVWLSQMDELNIFALLDYAGVAVFAATGALAASRKQLDIVGFIFLATITGIGGGTLRDLVLGLPVFWLKAPAYIIVCTAIGLLVYFSAYLVESRYRLLLWLDAIGLAAYSVMGAAKGFEASLSVTVALITGMMTACFGGILRDTIAGEASVILRPEIYLTAAMAGAGAYMALIYFGLEQSLAAAIGFITALAIRGGALIFGWTLPRYKPRAGR